MQIKVALVGNPNSGKTTMFNELTGSSARVGNWPGVTVEKKEGRLRDSKDVIITDLPGIYSLSPYTLEEVITRDYLINEKPDVIINLVDATNIERNLYLTTQLLETDIPVVVALNMIDIIRKNGENINIAKLAEKLGCPVIETSASKRIGLDEIAKAAVNLGTKGIKSHRHHPYSVKVEAALSQISAIISADENIRWYAVKVFERDEKAMSHLELDSITRQRLEKLIKTCESYLGDDSESIITNERYDFITSVVSKCVTKTRGINTTSDKIDSFVTNRWLALPIFAIIMFSIYYISVTSVGSIATDFMTNTVFGEWINVPLTGQLENAGVDGWLIALIVDGIVGGVGSVLGFVPQMIVLFLMLAILEECGYMSRVAFIMDKIFRNFGLSGKSFIPMLIGTGCSVPGIMASRTIENEHDRRMTVITTSFMPCGAKMPIVALIAGALFNGAWWVAPSAYFLGIASVIISGIILKKTKIFAGDPSPFVMELPAYHIPTFISVTRSVWERSWSFIKKAGTIILLASVLIWFLSNFGIENGSLTMVDDMNVSILAYIGGFIAPIFAPLGFGMWQSAVATVMGLIAKEEVVGVFGVLYGISGDVLEGASGDLSSFASHFTTLSGYVFLMFNLLCAPCVAAVGAIRREMNSGKWTLFAITYQTAFAYIISLIVYQLGTFISGGQFGIWTAAAMLMSVVIVWLLFRKPYAAVKTGEKNQVKQKVS